MIRSTLLMSVILLSAGIASAADDTAPPDPTSYDQARNQMFPLPPSEVRDTRRYNDDVQRARAEPIGPEVSFRTRSVNVRLDPGSQPEQVVVTPRNTTTLTFSDMTGQPWPIQFYVTANPGQFDVKAPGCDEAGNCKVGANMVMVTPLIAHAQGNLVITLRDQPVPVTVDLRVGNRAGADFKAGVADARLDLRIPGMGPNAMPPLVEASSLHQPDDQRMLAFLDGVPPQQAQQVHVSGLADVQAWRLGKTIYVRTPYAMLSPAWIEHVRGVSGMLIYAIEETPVLLLSAHGSVVTVSLGS